MNSYIVLWFLALICSFDNFLAQSGTVTGNSQLFLGKYPIPKKTKGPLNIETDKVENVALPILRFTATAGANTKVINTGRTIEARLDQATPGATVAGGPLLNDTYNFYMTRYLWSGNSSGPTGTLINGEEGAPIEATSFWYNQKYGSFKKAIKNRDGLAAISFPVRIDPLPNLLFIPFSNKLKKVRKPGSYVITNLAETFIWFDAVLPSNSYFAYSGSYLDLEQSKYYYCATVITFRTELNIMSQNQFENSFLKLKNSKGGQLINVAPHHPQGDIPVVQTQGNLQFILPLGKRLLDASTI